ncbi:ureidoglycolate lyase [Nonomuraea wenchangensis]|uniref:ureidoglycolate lyase n=1 Tax=Nonomuraea wenchangensis TaxID=568860 RepID=UPI00342B9107
MLSPDSPQHVITPEEFTAEAFAPYGEAMSLDATPRLPIDFYSGANAVHGPIRLDSDTPPEFLVFRVGKRGDNLRYLERHVEMTQTMIPLNGQPYVAVVAPPQVPLDNGFPVLDEVKAFIIPGDVSINLYRGTWHEPPFPSVDGQLFLITSHERLTRGLQCKVDENGELDQLDVEKRNPFHRTGQRVRVRLP